MDARLPDESQIDREKLGAFEAEYFAGSRSHYFGMVVLIVGIVLFGSIAVVVSVAGLQGAARFQRLDVGLMTLFFGIAIAVAVMPVICVLYLVRQYRRLRWRVLLFSNGLVFDRNRKIDVVLWDQIKYVYEKVTVIDRKGGVVEYHLRLVTLSNKTFLLDIIFRDIAKLARRVQELSWPSLLSRALRQIQQNEAVEFGSLKLSSDGMENKTDRMPWAEFQGVTIEFEDQIHKFVIRKKGQKKPWAKRPIPHFPNRALFVELVNRLRPRE
jgi:hypothetical protein